MGTQLLTTSRRFKTQSNATPSKGEVNNLPSQTIPDQSMTISEIMTRYAQGLGYQGPKVPSYDGGNDPLDGVNIHTLDLVEKHQMIDNVKEHIQDLKKPKPKKPQAPQATMETTNQTEQPAPVKPNESNDGTK